MGSLRMRREEAEATKKGGERRGAAAGSGQPWEAAFTRSSRLKQPLSGKRKSKSQGVAS